MVICHEPDFEIQAVKLIGFGFSTILPIESPLSFTEADCGTPHFKSPEIIRSVIYDPFKADAWAFGIILYMSLYGKAPFGMRGDECGESLVHVKTQITKGNLDFKSPFAIPDAAKVLIAMLLERNPKNRFSIWDALHSAFLHPTSLSFICHTVSSAQ